MLKSLISWLEYDLVVPVTCFFCLDEVGGFRFYLGCVLKSDFIVLSSLLGFRFNKFILFSFSFILPDSMGFDFVCYSPELLLC